MDYSVADLDGMFPELSTGARLLRAYVETWESVGFSRDEAIRLAEAYMKGAVGAPEDRLPWEITEQPAVSYRAFIRLIEAGFSASHAIRIITSHG